MFKTVGKIFFLLSLLSTIVIINIISKAPKEANERYLLMLEQEKAKVQIINEKIGIETDWRDSSGISRNHETFERDTEGYSWKKSLSSLDDKYKPTDAYEVSISEEIWAKGLSSFSIESCFENMEDIDIEDANRMNTLINEYIEGVSLSEDILSELLEFKFTSENRKYIFDRDVLIGDDTYTITYVIEKNIPYNSEVANYLLRISVEKEIDRLNIDK